MPVGARDVIDRKLVQMYANVQTNTHDPSNRIDPEQIWQSLGLLAQNNRAFLKVKSTTGARKENIDYKQSA